MGNEDVHALQAQLEQLVEECGLALVLAGLAAVCDDKRIDDPGNAVAWRDAAAALGDLSTHCDL